MSLGGGNRSPRSDGGSSSSPGLHARTSRFLLGVDAFKQQIGKFGKTLVHTIASKYENRSVVCDDLLVSCRQQLLQLKVELTKFHQQFETYGKDMQNACQASLLMAQTVDSFYVNHNASFRRSQKQNSHLNFGLSSINSINSNSNNNNNNENSNKNGLASSSTANSYSSRVTLDSSTFHGHVNDVSKECDQLFKQQFYIKNGVVSMIREWLNEIETIELEIEHCQTIHKDLTHHSFKLQDLTQNYIKKHELYVTASQSQEHGGTYGTHGNHGNYNAASGKEELNQLKLRIKECQSTYDKLNTLFDSKKNDISNKVELMMNARLIRFDPMYVELLSLQMEFFNKGQMLTQSYANVIHSFKSFQSLKKTRAQLKNDANIENINEMDTTIGIGTHTTINIGARNNTSIANSNRNSNNNTSTNRSNRNNNNNNNHNHKRHSHSNSNSRSGNRNIGGAKQTRPRRKKKSKKHVPPPKHAPPRLPQTPSLQSISETPSDVTDFSGNNHELRMPEASHDSIKHRLNIMQIIPPTTTSDEELNLNLNNKELNNNSSNSRGSKQRVRRNSDSGSRHFDILGLDYGNSGSNSQSVVSDERNDDDQEIGDIGHDMAVEVETEESIHSNILGWETSPVAVDNDNDNDEENNGGNEKVKNGDNDNGINMNENIEMNENQKKDWGNDFMDGFGDVREPSLSESGDILRHLTGERKRERRLSSESFFTRMMNGDTHTNTNSKDDNNNGKSGDNKNGSGNIENTRSKDSDKDEGNKNKNKNKNENKNEKNDNSLDSFNLSLKQQRRSMRVAKERYEEIQKQWEITDREREQRQEAFDTHGASIDEWEYDDKHQRRNLRTLLIKLPSVLNINNNNEWQPVTLGSLVNVQQLRSHYRKAVRLVHPDMSQKRGDSIETRAICERIFEALNAAWDAEMQKSPN